MNDLARDIRFAFRSLLRAPGFAAAAVVALGLGTGATTAVFSLRDGVVLRPLPYPDPDRLVMLWGTNDERGLTHERLSPVNLMDYSKRTRPGNALRPRPRPLETAQDSRRHRRSGTYRSPFRSSKRWTSRSASSRALP